MRIVERDALMGGVRLVNLCLSFRTLDAATADVAV
jgi:hypothetical protein